MDSPQRSDDELARQVAGGDEGAFAELYGRYFGQVYDFAVRLSRDRDIAALVVQSSFLRLQQTLRAGETAVPPKLQLFVNARHDVAERLRRQRGPVMEGEEAFVVADPSRLEGSILAADVPELARLAWQSARELKLDEYELLDLSVRRGLNTEEIAAILRTRPEAAEARLARTRDALEGSFSSLLLLHRGRRACLDLDFIVDEGKWSASLAQRILQHLRGCDACQTTRRGYMSATDLIAVLTLAPAPAGWEQTMLDRLLQAMRTGAMPAAPAPSPQPAPAVAPPRAQRPPEVGAEPAGGAGGPGMVEQLFGGSGARGPLLAVFGGGLLVVVVVLGALCSAGAFDDGDEGAKATVSPTTTATPTGTGTATLTPTSTATSTPRPLATATQPPPTLRPTATRPPTATPVPTQPPPPPTATSPPPPPTSTPAPKPTEQP